MPTPKKNKPQTEAGLSFQKWAAGRAGLTQTELLDIWAGLHGLRYTGPEPVSKPTTTGGQSFANWIRSRKKLTPEEIFDIEAETQALAEIAPVTTAKAAKPTVKPSLIITRTPYPKWWKTLHTASISLSTAGTQIIVPTPGRFTLFIATIVLTVSGETNISFGFGVFGNSGSMDLGGTDEPRGMVIAMGDSPAPCGQSGFTLTSNGVDVAVGGFVTYYLEKET